MQYLTTRKIRDEVNVKGDTVLAWIASGELLATNVTQRPDARPNWRIRREDFDAFLARRSTAPPAKPKRKPRKKSNASVTEFYK